MKNYSGFIVGSKRANILKKLMGLLTLQAFAEEVEGQGNGEDNSEEKETGNTVNYEHLIAQARKEEKDKMYPRIKKLEEENKSLLKSNNENLVKCANLEIKIDQLTKAGDSEEVIKMKNDLATLQAENQRLIAETPKAEDIRAEIAQEYEVKFYLTEQRNAKAEEILPIFAEEVTGSTKEEIDSSILKAIEKTVKIKEQLGVVADKTKADKTKQTKPPVSNPNGGNSGDKNYDINYIKNLDPRSAEYAEWRKSQGLK